MVRRLTSADYIRVPWKNGGGVSTTLAGEHLPGSAPGDWSGVIWQLGRTRIVTPAPFSDLTGFERMQTVVGGRGLFLDTPGGAIDLSKPLTVERYDGGTPIVSRLMDGPVEVVNLIARRNLAMIDLVVLQAGQRHGLAHGTHVLYACPGACRLALGVAECELAEDEALLCEDPGEVVVTAGQIILASIMRTGGDATT